jgi:aspartyl/asparaginyl beta-hydroxylase (cupin superfamily)
MPTGPVVAGEPVAYYVSRDWPKCRQPHYFDPAQFPGTKLLEENFEKIRAEILALYGQKPESFQPNFTPYAYAEEGWRTMNLYSYFLRYPGNCARLPVLDSIVRQIPGMSMAQVAVLRPRTRIKAHYGDTNGLVRSHLGILVPASLPDLGIRIHNEDHGWEEGKVFCICIAHRHYAWNHTDHHRIVLVVDVVRPDLFDRRYEVASNALAVITMKFFATRFPRLKRIPRPLARIIQALFAGAFRTRLWAQRRLAVGA